ncbi:orotate phosphoribosyltransferase [mine drainage metagenome]|uniref:orotate phosphoribosyltransferase n=1 Tax=mine drainage metagenome TaxID=410659 RepID=T1ASM8_9ZZZZ
MVDPSPRPTHAAIARALLDSGSVRFGRFTLASGQTSDVYVDVKRAWTDPGRLTLLAEALADRVGSTDRLAGMELGACRSWSPPHCGPATRSSSSARPPRITAPASATRGRIRTGDRVLLIEDVATTGGSSLESIAVLREQGAVVDRALVVVDRESGAIERLAGAGVRLEPLVTLAYLRGQSP